MKVKIVLLLLVSASFLYGQTKEHKSYYDNGKVKEIGAYDNDKKVGDWKTYYDNGQLETEGKYLNDEREGEWKEYYEDGQLEIVATYNKGLVNGNAIAYHENGEIRAVAYLIDDEPEGKVKEYNEDGNLLSSATFSNGEYVGVRIENKYYDNGQLEEHSEILNDKKHGKYERYYDNGILWQEATYKNDEFHGEGKTYYKNGTLSESARAINGELDGRYITYHENGNISRDQYFKMDEKDGPSKRYYKNGSLRESGNYVDDRKDGFWKEYDEKGYGWEGNYIRIPDEDNYIVSRKDGIWKFYNISKDGTRYLSTKVEYIKGKEEGRWQTYLSDGSENDYTIYKNGESIKSVTHGKQYIIEDYTIVGYEIWNDGVLKNTVRYDEEEKLYKIYFKNKCNQEIGVVIRIYNSDKKWENHGWYYLKPGEEAYLEDTKNSIIYYYAESDNGTWSGDNFKSFKGDKIGFKKKTFKKGEYGKRVVPLTCK